MLLMCMIKNRGWCYKEVIISRYIVIIQNRDGLEMWKLMRNTMAVAIDPFLQTHHVSVHENKKKTRTFSITQQNVLSFLYQQVLIKRYILEGRGSETHHLQLDLFGKVWLSSFRTLCMTRDMIRRRLASLVSELQLITFD